MNLCEINLDNKKVSFASLDRDSSSSGSITPTDKIDRLSERSVTDKPAPLDSDSVLQVPNGIKERSPSAVSNVLPERSVAEQLAPLDSHAVLQASDGIKERSPSAISNVGNEDVNSFATGNPSTRDQSSPFPGRETSRESYSAGPNTGPQRDVSSEDLRSVQGMKSKEPSWASSSPDVSLTKGEAPLAKPVNPEASLPELTPHFLGTDQKVTLPEPNSTRTLAEVGGSNETAISRLTLAGEEGRLLDLTIGVKAEVRQVGNQSPLNAVPAVETVRTVIEIPPSNSTDKRLSVPKIHVQNPTEGTEPEVLPRRVSASSQSSISRPRSLQSSPRGSVGGRSSLSTRPPSFIESKSAEDQRTKEEPQTPPLKRRKLYLRKVRNAAARVVILEITLGRQLAKQTKPKLRRLARGEQVGLEVNAGIER